jgi:hypothetical protein
MRRQFLAFKNRPRKFSTRKFETTIAGPDGRPQTALVKINWQTLKLSCDKPGVLKRRGNPTLMI